MVKFNNYTTLNAQWMTEDDLKDYPDILQGYVDALQLRSIVKNQEGCNNLRLFSFFVNKLLFDKTCLVNSKFNVHIRNKN